MGELRGGGFGWNDDDDVDTDDQEEDQELQSLLYRSRPHLAPTGR